MSHHNYANVWARLQGRLDIDNIVTELIGAHALWRTGNALSDPRTIRHKAIEVVVSCKAIFDLQRTYLQADSPSFESKSSLLSSDILRRAILYLVEIKSSVINPNHDHAECKIDCALFAHALLSGLRALLLRKPVLSIEDHRKLAITFRNAWKDENLDETCHFVIHFFCGKIIHQLGVPHDNNIGTFPACGVVELQDYFVGLYPVERHEHAFLAATQQIATSSDWFQKSLIFYDICWSIAAATIQLCVDVQARISAQEWNRTDEVVRNSDVNAILTTKLKVLDQIYRHSLGGTNGEERWCNEQIRGTLVFGFRSDCVGSECDCSNYRTQSVPNSLLTNDERQLLDSVKQHLPEIATLDEIETALASFSESLDQRKNALLDCNGELSSLAQKLNGYLQDWCPQPSAFSHLLDAKAHPADEFYVMSCPELHPVPAKDLLDRSDQSLVSNGRGGTGLPSFLPSQSSVRCKRCAWESSQMLSARKIEPLSRLSDQLQERLRHWQHFAEVKTGQTAPSIDGYFFARRPKRMPIDSPLSPSSPVPTRSVYSLSPPPSGKLPPVPQLSIGGTTSPDTYTPSSLNSTQGGSGQVTDYPIQRTMSTMAPIPCPPSPSLPEVVKDAPASSPDLQSQSSGQTDYVHSVFSQATPQNRKFGVFSSIFRSDKVAVSLPNSRFFTSGRRLLLWNELGAGYYDLHDLEAMVFQPWNTSGSVLLAAGGSNACAVISRVSAQHTLSIFRADQDHAVNHWPIDSQPYAVAVSRNDQFVALRFSKVVIIYEVATNKAYRHELPVIKAKAGRGNHLITFSHDSLSFATATRYEPERVITHWALCKEPNTKNKLESKAPFGHVNDSGLSSLVCASTSKQMALVTSYTEKGFPTLLRLSEAQPSAQLVPDHTGRIGSRVHRAALCPEGNDLVMVTQANDVYWIDNAFNSGGKSSAAGRGIASERVARVKRRNSVMREVEVGMPRKDEAHVFWIEKEKGRGVLVTVGRSGGKSEPVHLMVDMNVLLG